VRLKKFKISTHPSLILRWPGNKDAVAFFDNPISEPEDKSVTDRAIQKTAIHLALSAIHSGIAILRGDSKIDKEGSQLVENRFFIANRFQGHQFPFRVHLMILFLTTNNTFERFLVYRLGVDNDAPLVTPGKGKEHPPSNRRFGLFQ